MSIKNTDARFPRIRYVMLEKQNPAEKNKMQLFQSTSLIVSSKPAMRCGVRVRAQLRAGDKCGTQLSQKYQGNPKYNWCAVRGFFDPSCANLQQELDQCRGNGS